MKNKKTETKDGPKKHHKGGDGVVDNGVPCALCSSDEEDPGMSIKKSGSPNAASKRGRPFANYRSNVTQKGN